MKEERLIGNSGIQEVRQQCLDVLAEIREQAGILNDYFEVTDSQEYIAAWVDGDGKVVFGLKTDGKTFVGDADFLDDLKNIMEFLPSLESKIDWDALSIITLTDNPDFLSVETDEDGRILSSRNKDGIKREYVGFEAPKVSIDGHSLIDTEDLEGRREVTTDADGKIISYRRKDGTLVEVVGMESPKVETEELKAKKMSLSNEGLTDFEKALREHGFTGGTGDWTEASSLKIKEPYCALVDFSGISNMPQAKGVNLHGYMQFWDMNGNYFKKEVIMNAQGQSSMAHPKKNVAIDICNNNGWDDDDTFKLQIGDWVPQDSFHLKSYYMDPFRGLCPVGYKFYDKIVRSRGELFDYVWKRALIDMDAITPTSNGSQTAKDTEAQFNTGARCFPDGFPCIVYLNGEFYGIFSWQLKKHRDNYHMDKKNTKHIHLDGVISDAVLFDNNINWTQFEIRNPKSLITMSGGKYNGDAPTEIIDETSPSYDSSNKDHKNTAKVKQYIKNMPNIKTAIVTAYDTYLSSEKTPTDVTIFKEVFEEYFDAMNLVDYIIFSDVSHNFDGFAKNWQWITYDGVKWYICAYDCDGVFGGWWETNDYILPPLTRHVTQGTPGTIGSPWIFTPLYDVYKDDLEERYAELRRKDIIDTDFIIDLMNDWLSRIGGKDMFDKEWEKWPDYIKNDSIHRMYKWVKQSIINMDILYNYNI